MITSSNTSSDASSKPIYSFEDVHVVFRAHGRQVPVLWGFSVNVEPGERLVLRGSSGAGKTTVLNMMAGFLTPTLGSVRFDGRDLRSFTLKEISAFRNSEIGFVHQSFNLIPSFSSLANAAAPLLIAGWSRKKAREHALELLDRVGVAGRAEHRPGELSGGEQQRVAIARAVIRRPRVILADEPTGNLDAATSSAILHLLREVAGDRMTVVIATHDEQVTAFGTRVIEVASQHSHSLAEGETARRP